MGDQDLQTIELSAGRARLAICPDFGGAVTSYRWEDERGTIDWLRPYPGPDKAPRDPREVACFPLVPFSGRLREGRFGFAGREVALPLNFLPERHAIHGHGWQAPLQVVARSEEEVTIAYDHRADAWPWTYRARQSFTLTEGELTMEIEVVNESREAMPAGLGLHPYFVRTPRARITAEVAGMWRTDDEVMPTELAEPPPERDLRGGVVAEALAMDNTFTGWDGRAVIDWPEWSASLAMTAEPPLGMLVVYAPPDERFFCVEPVANCTDAFNMLARGRDDSGARVLQPGERLAAKVRLAPHKRAGP